MNRTGNFAGVSVVCVCLVALGFLFGQHTAKASASVQVYGERFKLIDSTKAFDAKTGKTCYTEAVTLPPGFSRDAPTCSTLATN